MKNLQKNFEKNGYVIVPGNKKLLDDLRKIIFHNIKKNKKIKLPRLYEEDFEKLTLINSMNWKALKSDDRFRYRNNTLIDSKLEGKGERYNNYKIEIEEFYDGVYYDR